MTASMPQLSEPIPVRPLKSEADYRAALAEIEELFGNAKPDTPQGDKLELLITLVEAYENQYYPMDGSSDPISLIEFVMEQQELTRKDLEAYIGPRQRVWDILERRHPPSLAMIRRLEKGLHIPAHLLIREYSLQRTAG